MRIKVIPVVIAVLVTDSEERTRRTENYGENRIYSDHSMARISEEFWRHEKTSVKPHQLILVWETCNLVDKLLGLVYPYYSTMIKMKNRNRIQSGSQRKGQGGMIGRCSPDNHHEGSDRHPVNAGCSFSYTIDDLINPTNHRKQQRKWTREDNKFALQFNFRRNPSQRRYWKKTIEIWEECARFHTTNQSFIDQIRMIIKKDRFSDLEISEIHLKINRESRKQKANTIINISNTKKTKKTRTLLSK